MKAASLTQSQREVLAALVVRFDGYEDGQHERPPSLAEVARDLGRATSSAHSTMMDLLRMELVKKEPGHRGYRPTSFGRKALKDAGVER